MPPNIRMPNLDGSKSSQDSLLAEGQSVGSTTPRKVPLVDLAGSPTSKRRQPSSVRPSRQRPDRTPGFRTEDSPVWVPSSAPTRLTNGYPQRSGSPSNSLETELSPSVLSNRSAINNGQLAHGRVAALQSQGRTRVYLCALHRHVSSGGGKGGWREHPPRAALCRLQGAAFGGAKVWNSEILDPQLSVLFTVHTNAIVVTIRITIGDLIAGVGAATKTFAATALKNKISCRFLSFHVWSCTKSLWTNHLREFHQIYNFGAG